MLAVTTAAFLLVAGAATARTVVGTPGNDRLIGTPRADSLLGLAGRDRLTGGAGSDFLHGGPGRDVVDGGPDADRIAVQYDGARDTVRCGRGRDLVNADPGDVVATECELVGRRLSRDPYSDPDSQHETEVEPDSFTFGRTTVATFQVGRRFDGAATNIGFATTADDGRSWRSGLLPGLTRASVPAGPNGRASDPVVAYDAANRLWLISTLATDGQTTRLTINRSSDGVSWDDALVAAEETIPRGIAFDKNWIAWDNGSSSPFRGRCYLVYTHSSDDDMLALQYTTDGGLTWSAETHIGVRPAVGVFPVVRPTGELVVVFLWETQPFAIAASRSIDGGSTFGAPVTIAEVGGSACVIRGFRAFSLPSADVGSDGRVWVTWHDCLGPSFPSNVVLVATSDDGVTWSGPATVTTRRNAVLPAIGVDPARGRVAIAFHTVRPAGVDVELVESRAGAVWGAPRRLSAQSMQLAWMPDTTSGRMLGDYISVHYAGARPLVVWALASEPVGSSLRQAIFATRG